MRRFGYTIAVLGLLGILFQNCTQQKLKTLSPENISERDSEGRKFSDQSGEDTSGSKFDNDDSDKKNDNDRVIADSLDPDTNDNSDDTLPKDDRLADILATLERITIADSRLNSSIEIGFEDGMPSVLSIANISCLQNIPIGGGLSDQALSLIDGLGDKASSISSALVSSGPISILLDSEDDNTELFISQGLLPISNYPDAVTSLFDYKCDSSIQTALIKSGIGPLVSGLLSNFTSD